MKKAPKIQDDQKRLEELYRYDILDSETSPEFDNITKLASSICDVPICVISLVDKNRQWFKSRVGLDACETARDVSFCGHAIESDGIFIVEDATKDNRFCDNPLVVGEPQIAFYAGVPLVAKTGFRLGTLCIIDRRPRSLSDLQITSLKNLSHMVMNLLEMRLQNKKLEKLNNQYEDVQDMSKTGCWELDLETNEVSWSKEIYRIHGLEENTPYDKNEAINFYAPHERPRITKLLENCLQKQESFDEIFEFYDFNKNKKWVRSIGKTEVNEKGEVKKLIGTFQDVTEAVQRDYELDLVLKNAEIGIWKLNIQTNDLVWDDIMYKIFDVSKDEFSGAYEAWSNSLAPESKEAAIAEINDAIAEKSKFDTTFAILRKDGTKRYIGARAEIERDEHGKPLMMTGINWDKTEEYLAIQKSHQEDKEKLDQLDSMLKSTPSCLKVIDKDGKLINMNPQGLALIEADDFESVKGANVYDLIEPEHLDSFKQFNDKVCNGEHGTLIFSIEALKGTKRWMETFAAPISLENGEIGHVAITNDITEKRKMEELVNHNSKLAAIGQLAAGVGHEINNPLTIIRGYVSTIMRSNKELSSDIKLGLEKIDAASKRINKIVSGLRTFSRLDKEGLDQSFNVYDLLSEIENMISEIYEKDNIKLVFDKENLNPSFFLKGERGKFEQVLMNLISNAKDATENQELRLINIVAENNKNDLDIFVQDNGTGVDEKYRNTIFDPFFTTKDVGKGTGIGLSLVHKFINDNFNGKIRLSNENTSGAKFIINLKGEISTNKEVANKPQTEEHSFSLRAIIADDEEGIRELLSAQLEDLGIESKSFENGKLALQEYINHSNKYDLIISDMKMPVMDGPTLLKELRANKALVQPKFFFITGGINVNMDDPDKPYFNDIDGLIFKPFNLDDFSKLISNVFPNKIKKSA